MLDKIGQVGNEINSEVEFCIDMGSILTEMGHGGHEIECEVGL